MQISEVNTYMHSYNNDRGIAGCPQEFFQGGPKICEGVPHNFLDKLQNMHIGGGGVVLMPAEFFSRGLQVY